MGANFSRIKTWIAEVLTASDLNTEFDNILNNFDPDGMDDASVNDAAMQAVRDPYPASAVSKPTDLTGEVQGLRFVAKQQEVTSQWYIYPDLISKTATYTATQDDKVILCDASGGGFVITLPTAVGILNKIFFIKNTGATGSVVVDGDGSETIDGEANSVLGSQFEFIGIVSDNANWQTIGGLSANSVTINGTQTLTNKTLTTPTIADLTNMTHDHADAGGGGTLGALTTTDLTVTGSAASPPDSNTLTKENIVKAWAHVTYSGGTPTLADNFNVSGIVDVGVGLLTLQWDTDFGNATYAINGTGADSAGGCIVSINGAAGLTTADADIRMQRSDTDALSDPLVVTSIAIGDQ
jgi:hypothetical protein